MTELSSEHLAMRDMARDFVRAEITPFASEWDRTETVPLDTVYKLGSLGLFGISIPAEWDGTGADFLSYVVITQELAYGDAGVCNTINATNSFALKVRDFGTSSQKERFLKRVARGEHIACMLLTEPNAGSDAGAIETRAERRGDRYVINGTKCFITSGRSCDAAVVLAVTDPNAGKKGVSAFLMHTKNKPGYRVSRVEHKLGHRTNDTCEIALEDLEVPVEDLLGNPGDGLKIAFSGLEAGRIIVAAQSVGVARAALDASVKYSADRKTFGKRIFDHQAIAFKLAEMATEVEVAQQMCLHAASMRQAQVRCIKEASIAKLFASQMCERVCSAAIQIHGGYGFVQSFPVEKYYRDCRVFQIYDGTNEIQKMLISRELALSH